MPVRRNKTGGNAPPSADPYPTHKPCPRLPADCYTGQCTGFLTICAAERGELLLAGHNPAHIAFQLGESAGRTGHLLYAWIIMPDHVHVLAQGQHDDADLREWVRHFKSRTAHGHKRRTGQGGLWQSSWYDRMLRKEEPMERVCQYIFLNPVRKGLCSDWRDWPWSGGHIHAWLMRDARGG